MTTRVSALLAGLLAARRSRSQRKAGIGIVLYDLGDPVVADRLEGIREESQARGWRLHVLDAGNVPLSQCLFPWLEKTKLGGVIFVGAQPLSDDSCMLRVYEEGLPVVVMAHRPNVRQLLSVDIDQVDAARQAVEHLIGHGHKRIAVISGPLFKKVGTDRLQGYREAIRKHRILLDHSLIFEGHFTEESGRQSTQAMLERKTGATALFVCSDRMALGTFAAIREAGLRVPDDLAVVGFDDLETLAPRFSPPLTTVRYPSREMGRQAVQLLVDQIEGKTIQKCVTLPTHLVVRQSCGCS